MEKETFERGWGDWGAETGCGGAQAWQPPCDNRGVPMCPAPVPLVRTP